MLQIGEGVSENVLVPMSKLNDDEVLFKNPIGSFVSCWVSNKLFKDERFGSVNAFVSGLLS